ncbi:RNA-dependent DNA polymerase [Pseudoscourfieldia marina]
MCYAPGGARHDPARWRGNTDAGRGGRGGRGGYQGGRGGRGGRHPLQYTPQPQHYTPQQHQNFQQLGGAYTTYPAYPVLATDASHHGIGGTQQYLPPPPPLPSQLMQNNIARYIVDNASPYTLTGSLNHLYDVQQLEKPKEIGGIKKDSTIKCTHVGKIDFTTHEGTLTVSNAYYGFYFGQIDVETAYLYALILERFGFTSAAKSATTPLAHGTTLTRADEEDAEARHLAQQFVGAILYAAIISQAGPVIDRIKYNTNSNVPLKLIGYCDASWGDNHENRRSTSGYIFFLNGGPISWASYQTTVALSTVESEVMALTEAIKEAIYIRRLLESLGAAQEGPTIIYTDSTGAEALVDHPTSHRRTKHIEIRREFIKFHIGHETVKIERVSTKDQLGDIMTKPPRQDIHNYLVQMILHG